MSEPRPHEPRPHEPRPHEQRPHEPRQQDDKPIAVERAPSGRFLQKRDTILAAAARKFNLLGVRGATLEDIARDVGMNLTSIRHYFRRKDDLVAAGYLHSISVHADRLGVALTAGNREARVRSLVSAYFNLRRAIREGTGPEVMIFGDMRSLSNDHAALVWPRYAELFEIIRRAVSDPSELASDHTGTNVRTYYVMSQLFRSLFWLPSYPVESFGWVEEKFADILLNGIAAPGTTFRAPGPYPPDPELPEATSWESFLLAATRLINEQGYRGASVEAIARKLNRTKGSFYHHVDGKGDLLAACFNRSLTVMQEAQRAAIAAESRGLNQAYAAVAELVRRQQTSAGPLLRSSALMSADTTALDHMLRELAQVVTRFSGMVTDGIIDGSARPCDPRIAGEMIMVTVNSAAQINNWTRGVTPDNIVDYYARPMIRGLFN